MRTAAFYAIACVTFFLWCEIVRAQNTSPFWSLAGNSNASPSSKLGTTGNISLRFYTNNVQRMIMNSVEGYVGIGTATPNARLHVNTPSGQNAIRAQVNGSTKFLVSSNGGVAIGSSLTPPANGLFVSGRVGIGIEKPAFKLDVAGNIQAFDSYFGSTFGHEGISVGRSGGSYGSVGYGLKFTDTTANYRYRVSDPSSMINFHAGGFIFNAAPFGTAGNTIPYSPVVTILQNGNVGIGTSSPAYKFSVTATAGFGTSVAFIENTVGDAGNAFSDGLYIKAGSLNVAGSRFIMFLRPDGLQIGRIAQASTNSVNYATTSDKRLKNVIGISQKGLSDLMKIKIYDYTFKSDADKKVVTGFMAQELYDIFPQSVSKPVENNETAEKNPWMVDYGSVTPLIIRSVQEQQQMIDELKTFNSDLKKQNENLQERIIKLEAALAAITANNNGNISNGSLEQNKPNPFTKTTTIRYSMPQGSKGQINIYDATGKLVKTLKANENGLTELSGYDLAAGTYTYALTIKGKAASSKQMLIMK